MSAQQGAPDVATQVVALAQQHNALQGKVATLWVDNATLQENKTTQINAHRRQPPNVQVARGTGATSITVTTTVGVPPDLLEPLLPLSAVPRDGLFSLTGIDLGRESLTAKASSFRAVAVACGGRRWRAAGRQKRWGQKKRRMTGA